MLKLENDHLTIIMEITDLSIEPSTDTKASGSKCHEKQDIYMVSKNHSLCKITYLITKKK